MTLASNGLGAMVWRLRRWKGGDPVAQADQAVELGLQNVSIKINDGRQERWEGNRPDQNADLLPATVQALQKAGIKVTGWGWTYGGRYIARVFRKSADIARAEGELAARLCLRYGMDDYLIDAEKEYVRPGMAPVAEALCESLEFHAPNINHLLCSYRFPLQYQRDFPIRSFAPFMEGWAPQVYWIRDNRPTGGAIQLELSKRDHYDVVRKLPYVGVAPTYRAAGPWTASKIQLTNFFERAVEIGCAGVSVWDLPQATGSQLEAIKEFDWPGVEPPAPQPPPVSGQLLFEGRVQTGKLTIRLKED